LVGLQKIWAKLRDCAGFGDVRLHDLRHTYASVGAASGESLCFVGKLVGHKQHATTQRYAHLADDPLRAAADRIATQISAGLKAHNNLKGS
jgi:integrase